MTYEYRCSKTVLTCDALLETLGFLYQPATERERHYLESFAIASCDSWCDVHGNKAYWLWLGDRMKWRPKQKNLTISDLGLIAERIENVVDTMPSLIPEGIHPAVGIPSKTKKDVIVVDSCTVSSLTSDALAQTLSFILQPEDAIEDQQIERFADAVCRVWSVIEGDEECWRIYTGWLRTHVHLGKIPTCTDLDLLSEKMEEHLMIVQLLKVSKSLAKSVDDDTQIPA